MMTVHCVHCDHTSHVPDRYQAANQLVHHWAATHFDTHPMLRRLFNQRLQARETNVGRCAQCGDWTWRAALCRACQP